MTKNITITTKQLQHVIISLMHTSITEETIVTREDADELIDLFASLNKLCWEGNDYTLKVTVNA